MCIIIQTTLTPTAAVDTCGGPGLLSLYLGQEPCHSVPTKAVLDSAGRRPKAPEKETRDFEIQCLPRTVSWEVT